MTLTAEQVQALELLSNAEARESVIAALGEKFKLPTTVDTAFEFVKADKKGKELLANHSDARVQASVQTAITNYETTKLPAKLEEVRNTVSAELEAKYNPTKTEAEKKLEASEKRIAELERQNKLSEVRSELSSLFAEKKIPTDFLDNFVDVDKDVATAKATKFAEMYTSTVTKSVESQVAEAFKKSGYDPKQNKSGGDDFGKLTQKHVDDAYNKAKESGRLEDRITYATVKSQYNEQQLKLGVKP
jgi:hypothetical protein